MRSFAGNPRIPGRTIRIGTTRVRIAGVAPAGSWQLPGAPDAWILESNAQVQSEASSTAYGYLFAHLSPRGQASMSGPNISISALTQNGIEIDLFGTPIVAPIEGTWSIFEFALFLALVALPAVISVSLGDSDITAHRPSLRQRINRILFPRGKAHAHRGHRFLRIARSCVQQHHWLFAFRRMFTASLVLHHLSLRLPLGRRRPAQTMPRLPAPRHQSCQRGPGLAHLPRLERHRDDMRRRSRPAPRSVAPHQLVQRRPLALSRQFVGLPLRRHPHVLTTPHPKQPTAS